MLGLAVGLHGALLKVPMPNHPPPLDTASEASTSSVEVESIQVVRVPTPTPTPTPTPFPEPNPTPSPAPKPVPPSPIPAPIQPPTPAPTPTPIPIPTPTPQTLDERLQDIVQYSYNPSMVKSVDTGVVADVSSRLATEYDELGIVYLPSSKFLDPLHIAYPLDTCLPEPPNEGYLSLVVTPNGNLERPPEWISSTGYEVLDEKAIADLESYPLPTPTPIVPDALTGFGLTVIVDYDPNTCKPPA